MSDADIVRKLVLEAFEAYDWFIAHPGTSSLPEGLSPEPILAALARMEEEQEIGRRRNRTMEETIDRLKNQLAEADANGLRLAEELADEKAINEGHTDAVRDLRAEVERLEVKLQAFKARPEYEALEDEVERLRAALERIAGLGLMETDDGVGQEIARQALEGSTSEAR